MKKLLITLAICVFSLALASAGVDLVLNLKPYFTIDTSPAGLKSDAGNLSDANWLIPDASWWQTRQDYWQKLYAVPSVLDIGFTAKTDNVNMALILDIRQDPLHLLKDDGKLLSNIPFVSGMIELNFPRVGFVEYTSDDGAFFASVGRRQIKWGPNTYDMALADSQPYLDSLYAKYTIRMDGDWSCWYSFISVDFKTFLDYPTVLDPQSLFAHRVGFESSNLRIIIAELNKVYGKEPSLVDYTPFGLWHNNYQDSFSNVMLNLALEGLVGPVRLSGTFTMDDFDLPHEVAANGWSNKPKAMGFTVGVEVNLLDGEKVETTEFEHSDYAIREQTFKKDTGLNLGYEFYYCSTFMYNRSEVEGKFVSPYQFISLTGSSYGYGADAYYLGFKYGPDTLVHRIYAEYSAKPLQAMLAAEYLRRGKYRIESPYGDKEYYKANGLAPLGLNEPIVDVLRLEGKVAYYLDKSLKIEGGLTYEADLTHNTGAIIAKAGASIALNKVDWDSLFK